MGAQYENDGHENIEKEVTNISPRVYEVSYLAVFFLTYFHFGGFYGAYLCVTKAKWASIIFAYTMFVLSTIGLVVGVHKLWSHRSFKAKLPLEIFLMVCYCMAFQRSVHTWVRDHRVHHKYSDTDADPHNSNRGFFFCHIGWLMVRKHPEVKRRGQEINMDDIKTNVVLDFHKRHLNWLLPTAAFIIPTVIPVFLWNEDLSTAWHLNLFRFIMNMNQIFFINSVGHMWGYRPYDKTLKACQNIFTVLLSLGEGFHNFHHAFPQDYRGSGNMLYKLNFMAMFIDLNAKLGLAYDLKVTSDEFVQKKMKRIGDGSLFL